LAAIFGGNRRQNGRRDDRDSEGGIGGTLIHNGKCGPMPPFPVFSLAVFLIKPPV
jgi:hypothetical protein